MAPTIDEVRAQVAARSDRLGLPSWSSPRPDGAPPGEDEYSRLTDPARYRVVHARARVWAQVLADVAGATVEELPGAAPDGEGRTAYDRGLRVTSPLPGTLALLLLERDVPSGDVDTLPVLDVAVQRPDLLLDSWPDCGCDACDHGSADLLDGLDSTVAPLVGGPFVVLSGPRFRSRWFPDGGGASSQGRRAPAFARLMAWSQDLAAGRPVRLPRGTEALVGRSWLGDDAPAAG